MQLFSVLTNILIIANQLPVVLPKFSYIALDFAVCGEGSCG